MNKRSLGLHRAVERARWLAELAAALDQASALARELRVQHGGAAEVIKLSEHIGKLRRDVDSFQRAQRADPGQIHPSWM